MKAQQSCAETQAARRQVMDLLQKVGEDVLEKGDETKYAELALEDAKTSGGDPKTSRGDPEDELRSGGRGRMSGSGALCASDANCEAERSEDGRGEDAEDNPPHPPSPSFPPCVKKSEDCPKLGGGEARAMTHTDVSKRDEDEGAQDGGDYLSRRGESEDYEEGEEVSLVLFDDSGPRVTEDESHYITTHEIQLSELSDHEGDYDIGVASSSASWDIEEDHQAYSFVGYAFESDGAGERGDERPPPRAQGAAAVSTLLENDPAKLSSSDESASKPQQEQPRGGGQIHLSIRTTSRAINDPGGVQEQENILYHARRSGDVSRYAEQLRDRAKCFIAAPGRVHFGGKFRGKEVTGYSSGTSSAVSELDDADKEVRNLTARAFKSLAYPYLDAINFSTSSESSASEHGLGINRWSTFVDLKYGNVNMSQGLDQSLVSCQNSFEIAKNIDNRGYKGVALAAIKPPSSKIFTLNGNPQQIQLMGPGGVIRLTETLNFRCNVKSGMSAGERRTNFAQNAAGSRSADEVTGSGQRRRGGGGGGGGSPCRSMEGAHKKAVFASSLIKNVISKKMQFEQERKMERGEITEPQRAGSPCAAPQEGDAHRARGGRELQRQSSRFSESSSDYAIMCADELGDFVDSGSCDTRSESRRRDACAPAREANLEPANEGGMDTKKGALEASRSTLLRSQNSAFRCWKDEDLGFQKDHKSDKTLEDKLLSARDEAGAGAGARGAAAGSKLTKMSHLFVPSIQLLPSDAEAGQQLQRDYGVKLRSDNTLYISDSRTLSTSKSPEIKINLRSVREQKTEPFSVSKLRAPNLASSAAGLIRPEDFKCQALAAALKGESADKVPHFTVRDIRDNKGKLQTPIHQVRDVRKLVKSSYHFVSLDNDSQSEQRKQAHHRNPNSVSPIVIKCQSVNTNNAKDSEDVDLVQQETEADKSSPEGAKMSPPQRGGGRVPAVSSSPSEGGLGLRVESKVAPKKQDKGTDVAETKVTKQVALEKLQAAVKTMEQLYVFEKNEWKRKNQPQPLMDSHVLSLITSEQQGGPEEDGARGAGADKLLPRDTYQSVDKTPPETAASPSLDSLPRWEDRDLLKALQASCSRDERTPGTSCSRDERTPGTSCSRDERTPGTSCSRDERTPAKSTQVFSRNTSHPKSSAAARQQSSVPQTSPSSKSLVPKSPKLPMSLKISRTRLDGQEGGDSKDVDGSEFSRASADSENYLTIPVKPPPSSAKQPTAYMFAPQAGPDSPPGQDGSGIRVREDRTQTRRSSIVMETRSPEIPSATFYHSLPLGVSANQPQVYCFSPAVTPAMTPAPALDPFQPTQRKMLLDPTTGSYYLVDTPVQPATRRLFDPETGQYVDVPMPQPPMTPVPMPMSPLALSPGAYGHTYMIYPGFMPAPSVIPARTLVQSQVSSDADSGEKAPPQPPEGVYMETPFYMATGKSPQAAPGAQQQVGRQPLGFSGIKQPVISITSQQGPRIIAPPSFDGTTMSFVVEHR